MQQNLLVVDHHQRFGVSSTAKRQSSTPNCSIKFQKFPIPIGIFSLQIFLLLILCAPLAMSVPGIPESWEKCSDQGICLNKGKCFTDGISEFCHCEDGYGGQKCERLLDAIFFSETPEQLSRLCKIAFLLGIFALFVAIFGWTCCCMKHLNARKLYLQNLKLARENQRLSKRTIRLYAALARAKGLIGVEEEENIRIQQQIISTTDLTPADEYASGGPIHSSNRPNSSSDSRHSFGGQPNANANPNHRILMRELSEMHDELRKSIEGVDRILEIKEKDGGEVKDGETMMMPNWKWNWQRLRGRILLLKRFNGRREVDSEGGECERLENGNNNNNRESPMNEKNKNKSIFVRILNR